jgi:hypothetical protein
MDHTLSYTRARGWSDSGVGLATGRMKARPQTAILRRSPSSKVRPAKKRPHSSHGSMSPSRYGSEIKDRDDSERMEARQYLKDLRIIDSPRISFDSGDASHPEAAATIPKKIVRPLSKSGRRTTSTSSPYRTTLKSTINSPGRSPIKADKQWGLGRQFSTPTMGQEEVQEAVLSQWIQDYNDEKKSYRSTSVQIDTSFGEARVFAEDLPPANKTTVSVAMVNFDRVISVCGRYRRHLLTIRDYLTKAIYTDPSQVPPAGGSTLDTYASLSTYFLESADLMTELDILKLQVSELENEKNKHSASATKHRRKSIGRMMMSAARSSSQSAKQEELAAQLKVHNDHLEKLHTRTYEMIVGLLVKLSDSEISDLGGECLAHFPAERIQNQIINLIQGNEQLNNQVVKEALCLRLTKQFSDQNLLVYIDRILKRVGAKKKTGILVGLLKLISAPVRQTAIVELLMEKGDRTEIFGKLMKLVEQKDKGSFLTFVMTSLFSTSHLRVHGNAKFLKNLVGATPDHKEVRMFAEDFVNDLDVRGRSELSMFQKAMLEHLINKADFDFVRQLVRVRRDKMPKSQKPKLKQKRPRKQPGPKKEKPAAPKTPVSNDKLIRGSATEIPDVPNDTDANETKSVSADPEKQVKPEVAETPVEDTKVASATAGEGGTTEAMDVADDDDLDSLASDYEEKVQRRNSSRTIATQTLPITIADADGSSVEGTGEEVLSIQDEENNIVKQMRPFAKLLGYANKTGSHLTYHKTLALIYDTYANKIVADNTADRTKLSRESLGDFITRLFKNQFGLETRVKSMLAGLIKSLAKFKSRSKRITQFSDLVGMDMSHEYSAKTCDLYLNMIKICFPKFSKATLTKQVEGKCFVKLNVARKCVRRVFPVKKALKFQVGRLKLRQDIFDELYMTVNRISKPRIGVDFDIMTDCCIEAATRQFAINVEVLKSMFAHHKHDDSTGLQREEFNELIQNCAEGITDDELEVIWEETHQFKLTKSNDSLSPEIFSHICSKHGIAPPSDWAPPVPEQTEDGVGRRNSLGVLLIGFKLKSMANKVREKLKIPEISRECQMGKMDRMEQLLEEEADINEQDHRGTTPLMHAAWWGHLDCVQLLVENGADINARNHRWNTALHFAYEEKHDAIIALLETHGAASMENKIGLVPADFKKAVELEDDDEDVEN